MDRTFLLIKVEEYWFTAKTRNDVALSNNGEDCSKLYTQWKDFYYGQTAKNVFEEFSQKQVGEVKDGPTEITDQKWTTEKVSVKQGSENLSWNQSITPCIWINLWTKIWKLVSCLSWIIHLQHIFQIWT